MDSPVGELQTGAGNEVLHRARDQHLARPRMCRDAGANMHRDARKLVAHQLTLARVGARPHAEAQSTGALDDCSRAADCAGRTVEGSKDAITRSVDLATAEPGELKAHGGAVAFQQVSPSAVAEFLRPLSGSNNIREKHSGEHPVWLRRWAGTRDELLDLREHRLGIAHPLVVIRPSKLYEARCL